MLAQLAVHLGRDGLAMTLGVPALTVTSWREGTKRPSAAAVRCVWLLWCLVLHPDRVSSVWSIATWGRFEIERRHVPAPQEDWCI